MGFDFIVIAPLLPSHCGFSFVFGCGVSFLLSSSVFLSMIIQQLVLLLHFKEKQFLYVENKSVFVFFIDIKFSI